MSFNFKVFIRTMSGGQKSLLCDPARNAALLKGQPLNVVIKVL